MCDLKLDNEKVNLLKHLTKAVKIIFSVHTIKLD